MPANVIEYDLIDRPVGEENFIWQYDFGQKIKFKNIDLPFSYEVHFANKSIGPAEKQLGDASGVVIPYNVTKTGKPVYFWLYVTGENKSVTIYGNHVPVRARASVPTTEPTPEEQSFIEQALGVINDAMEVVQEIPDMVIAEIEKAIEEGKIKGDPGAVFTPHITDGVMTWTNNGDLPNPDPTDFNQQLGLNNFATKQELSGKIDTSQIGSANGVAGLDASGRVPSEQLPSYVDDVLEFASLSMFPMPGESGKIYISLSNNHQYRWTGTQYIDITSGDLETRKADKRDTVLETTLSRGRAANTTIGTASIAFGEGNEASGLASDAFGRYTTARGNGAFAEGSFTTAQGVGAHAEGHQTGATAEAAHAEGEYSSATSLYAHAEGYHTLASGNGAHAEGNLTEATEDYAHVEGYHSKAKEDYSHAEGYYTETTGNSSHAEGREAKASGQAAHAEGQSTLASGDNSHAEGAGGTFTYNSTEYTSRASGTSSHSEGDKTVASGIGAHSEGHNTFASGEQAHSEGAYTIASAPQSHAEGNGTLASGTNAHAEGRNTIASGSLSHAEGYGGSFQRNGTNYTSGSLGDYSHSEGDVTVASGDGSHSEGFQTIAAGNFSHTEGYNTNTSAIGAHAEGYNSTASGSYAHAEGLGSTASGDISHAEGASTIASGDYSHAEGASTQANAYSSHSEGSGTQANGSYAHAEGGGTQANGYASHSEGEVTVASGKNSHAGGMYNIPDSYANWTEWTPGEHCVPGDKRKRTRLVDEQTVVEGFICKTENSDSGWVASHWTDQAGKMNYVEIIGNGTADDARSNARALDWDGNERLMGDVYVGCNPDSTGGTKLEPVTYMTLADAQAIIDGYGVSA